ncbi:MAG TPA: 1-phosphofructokinase family hexose kinase [Verrucomicrobiae bacterium]|nr:1-phosphofructokinase family hexose kinase [Verrucomicrobiae bacterium]
MSSGRYGIQPERYRNHCVNESLTAQWDAMDPGKVLVVSLNPAVDCEWEVERVQWEEKNNILRERRWAGGKGSNVARWLRHVGTEAELLVPLGGEVGKELAGYLRAAKVRTHIVWLKQPTRVNVIVTDRSGGQMRFNPLGPILSRSEWAAVVSKLKACCCGTVIFSGALPRGVPANAYKILIQAVRKRGATPILDCDGAAFAGAIEAGPELVKPNQHELELWWQRPVKNLFQPVAALAEKTGGWVVVSRGRDGAVIWNSRMRVGFAARPPKVQIKNTVGAGDAMLAAIVRRRQICAPPEEWIRWGVAAGTAAVACEGGVLASAEAIQKIHRQLQVRPFP